MAAIEHGGTPQGPANGPATRPPLAHPLMYRAVRAMSGMWRPLAGHRAFPLWAVLYHRGRRTGRDYAVPIGIRATADAYYIALPFGPGTQWVQNVLAAGGCSVRWRGKDIQLTDPALVAAEVGAHAFPAAVRWMMRGSGTRSLLRLRAAGSSTEARSAVS